MPYHFIIAPDGQVYEGRRMKVPGDTNTEYDPVGHVRVMLLGNFEVQEPTAQQWNATVHLLARLTQHSGLDASAVGAHRHFSAQTVCPGAKLHRRFEELRTAVAAQLALAR